jgi:hypothetical protein
MSISAKQYQKRLQKVTKLSLLREMVNEELIKDEKTIKILKEQDFLQGDIYGNDTYSLYHPNNSYEANQKAGYKLYEPFKNSLNPLANGHVDLILTGAFVDAMYLLKPKQGRYKFGNTDKKRNILKEMYGDNIFGLNQNVFNKYQKEIIAPRFLRRIKTTANIG